MILPWSNEHTTYLSISEVAPTWTDEELKSFTSTPHIRVYTHNNNNRWHCGIQKVYAKQIVLQIVVSANMSNFQVSLICAQLINSLI